MTDPGTKPKTRQPTKESIYDIESGNIRISEIVTILATIQVKLSVVSYLTWLGKLESKNDFMAK